MKSKILFLLLCSLIIAFVSNANYAEGNEGTPPADMTGAPGTTETCLSCHSPGTGGSGSILITFNAGNNQYIAGQSYLMSVTLSQVGQKRWGFSMVARNSDNQNIGTWIPTNIDSKTYASNTHIGHKNAPVMTDTYTFHFSWIAPATTGTGDITFYGVGNAANNDANSTDDYIYFQTVSIAEIIPQPTVHLRLYLEGTLNAEATAMNTNLQAQGLLPSVQPYNIAPWYYNGTETITQSNPNITDWVLLEARNAANPGIVEARKAALLLSNGSVQDADGSLGVTFTGLATGSYYIAVKHRNHLAAMSAVPITLPNGNACASGSNCDLRLPQNTVQGNLILSDKGNGYWALSSGDINHDGAITFHDFNNWRSSIGFFTGYFATDVNLDGQTGLPDFRVFRPNFGKTTLTELR